MIGAVDIGGTKIAVGIVDDNGKVCAKLECPTDAQRGYPNGLARIIEMLRETSRQAGVEISGIGVGSTGMLDSRTGTFGDADFLPGWQRHNPVQDLAREFAVRVALENDGDAAALGEAAWGVGAGKANFRLIYVTVGTGIGGGVIVDSRLYRGTDMSHPEIGHHVIDASGPECSCGYRGCWEALATGPAMAEWFNKTAAGDHRSSEKLSAAQICELARGGDELANRAVEREVLYLGLGVANLINLFVPDVIVFGGSMMKSADLFLDGMHKVIRQGCRFVPHEKTELALASLGDDANLIGAARVWHYRFVENGGSL